MPLGVHRLHDRKHHVPRKPLPWVVSPVDSKKTPPPQASTRQSSWSLPKHDETSATTELGHEITHRSQASGRSTKSNHVVYFKPRHESTAIELFYDLFFVANLTVFTENNEIDNPDSMASYLGFFTILWFTWLQVSLFDVRFATNSILSRFEKAVALFVMGIFAFSEAMYDTSDVGLLYVGFRLVCYALITQRGVLLVSYGSVLWFVRKSGRGAILPIALTMGVLFTTAMAFLGLIFTFNEGVNNHTYVAFYILSVIEAVLVVAISCIFRTISFRSTNLVERVGLLTLIVLGEGVIGVIRVIATTLINTYNITDSMAALGFGALILLHELWILYFDQIEHDRFGTIRQQIWTLLHFPLHMALILAMQGNARFISWKTGWDAYTFAYVPTFASIPQQFDNSTSAYFRFHVFMSFYDYQPNLTFISHLDFHTPHGQEAAAEVVQTISSEAVLFMYDVFQIDVPRSSGNEPVQALYQSSINVMVTTYTYYIASSAAILIILGLMFCFGKSHKSRYEWVSISLRIVAGIALGMVLLTLLNGSQAEYSVISANWTIPIVLLTYAVVILLDDILIWLGHRRYLKTKESGEWDLDPENAEEDQLGETTT